MVNNATILIISLLALSGLASASNLTLDYYCPKISCTDTNFPIWVEINDNGTSIINGTVRVYNTTSSINLAYNETYEDYRHYFTSSLPFTWNYTIEANISSELLTANCSTDLIECYALTINLWEEVEYEIYANTSNYAVRVKNYDKQLNDPYINDFAYIIAINRDIVVPGLNNESCNVPFGSGQELLESINIGNWLGTETSDSMINLVGGNIGCDNYWFRAKSTNGQAILQLPYAGNYSLYLLDGTIQWHNEFSPPNIIKSNLFLPLGNENIPSKTDFTDNFWISHAELDFWGSITDMLYVPLILLGFLIFVLLIVFGFGFKFSLGITLLWIAIWTILRMF